MWSGVNFARSVTSSPRASGRGTPGAAQASKHTLAASGSQWTFHSVVGAVLPALR
jgi:hypothetical protein